MLWIVKNLMLLYVLVIFVKLISIGRDWVNLIVFKKLCCKFCYMKIGVEFFFLESIILNVCLKSGVSIFEECFLDNLNIK